jgi:glucosamine kinase
VSATPERWAVGVDGGGSRGRAWAAPVSHPLDEAPIGRAVAERSCNPYAVGAEAAAEAVLAVIDAAWANAGQPHAALAEAFVTVGIAGVDRPAESAALTDALVAGGLAPERLEVVGDPWIALEGALPTHGDGLRLLLVAGTGSVAVAADGASRRRAGGWGSRVGDEGSGAWLGIEAVRATLRALDGRDPPGPLADAVEAAWGAGVDALVGRSKGAAPADFAALAPLVLEHARRDPAAGALLARGVHHLVELVMAAAAGREPAAIAWAGGLATALAPQLEAALPPAFRAAVRTPMGPPVAGAWAMARRRGLVAAEPTETAAA